MDEVQEEAVAVIDETLRLLEKHGWCQHSAHNAQDQICMGWAFHLAAKNLGLTDTWPLMPEYQDAVHMASLAFHTVCSDAKVMSEFNDRDDTTYQDVVNTLKLMREEILNPQDEVILNG